MANDLRVRQNFLGGLVEDAPLTSSATTLTSAALAAAVVIGSTQHMAITLDPDGIYGEPEIAYITAHTTAAGTATILRAQEGSTARQHLQDTPWVHGPNAQDFTQPSCRAYLSANQTVNNTTVTVIALNAESFDDSAMHDTVTNNSRITIARTGKYLVSGCVQHSATSGQIQTRIHKNGTQWSIVSAVGNTVGINLQNTDVMSLVAGDYLELAAYQTSGSSAVATGAEVGTYLSVARVGD